MKKAVLVMVLAMTLIASPAMAKQGFYLGVNLLFNDLSGEYFDGLNVDSGSGLGLRGGFGLNRYLAFEAGLWRTDHDFKSGGGSVDLTGATLDLKVNFPLSGSHIEPYLLVGVGSYTVEQNGFEEDGDGLRLGIGMDIYFFPELSFNVGLTRNNATFKHAGMEKDGKITTLDFGLSYHFI